MTESFPLGQNPTAENVPSIKARFTEFWENHRSDDVKLDFGEVTRIDEKGIEFILFVELEARARQGRVFAINLSPRLLQIFGIVGLESRIVVGSNERKSDL